MGGVVVVLKGGVVETTTTTITTICESHRPFGLLKPPGLKHGRFSHQRSAVTHCSISIYDEKHDNSDDDDGRLAYVLLLISAARPKIGHGAKIVILLASEQPVPVWALWV